MIGLGLAAFALAICGQIAYADSQASAERWSFDFQAVDVRQALQLLAELQGADLVLDKEVEGVLTMRVRDATWEQALENVLASHKLEARMENGLMRVIAGKLAPIIPDLLPMRYAEAQDIAKLLRQSFGSHLAAAVDERSNTLLLSGEPQYVASARELARDLDQPLRQLQIEASIVVVRSDWARRVGFALNGRWEGGGDVSELSSDLGLEAASGSLQVLRMRGLNSLQVQMAAMEASGNGKVLSNPRIITGDRQTATIKSGTQIPFQESAPNGRTTVQFKDAVLKLDVTPLITPENRVLLKLVINQDAPSSLVESSDDSGNQIPAINTTELRTRILLDDGQTIALGGVFREENISSFGAVPVLSDIPVLGGLFRRKSKSTVKTETKIFITPKILPDGGRG